MVAVVIFMRGSLLTVCSALKTASWAEVCWRCSFFLLCPLYHFLFSWPCERHFHHRTTWCILLLCVTMQLCGVSPVFPYIQLFVRWENIWTKRGNMWQRKERLFSSLYQPYQPPQPFKICLTSKWKHWETKITMPRCQKRFVRSAEVQKLLYRKKKMWQRVDIHCASAFSAWKFICALQAGYERVRKSQWVNLS